MAVAANYPDDPEEDKPLSKIEKIIAALANIVPSECVPINKVQSMMAAQEKMFRATLGHRLMYDSVTQEAARLNQLMQGVVSSSVQFERTASQLNQDVASHALRAAAEIPRIEIIRNDAASLSSSLRYFENEMNQASKLAASVGSVAVHNYSQEIYKSFLDSQFSVQSRIETCKSALEATFSNQRYNQDILANGASVIQQELNSTWITKDFFQESYTKVIQTISKSVFPTHDLMFESVRCVLENERLALHTAAQLSSQGVLKDVLSNTQSISNFFTHQSDLIQKATAPFIRQWSWLVCEAKLVSVDIYHDESHLMYAEYDRDTVTELLTARFAIEATEPDISINSSGSLEQPNDLFECSGEHEGHHADYDGETVLNSKDDNNTNKALLQYLDEARNSGVFDDDEWDQIETNARCAEKIVREIYGDMMHIALSFSMEIAVLCVKNNHISAEEFRALHEKEWSRLRKLLPKPEDGRPQGSGLFKNTDDFLTALKDVLGKAHKKPTQIVALRALRQHPLCQIQTTDELTQNHTKTLRNWLKECGMMYKDALERYWKPAQKGK